MNAEEFDFGVDISGETLPELVESGTKICLVCLKEFTEPGVSCSDCIYKRDEYNRKMALNAKS